MLSGCGPALAGQPLRAALAPSSSRRDSGQSVTVLPRFGPVCREREHDAVLISAEDAAENADAADDLAPLEAVSRSTTATIAPSPPEAGTETACWRQYQSRSSASATACGGSTIQRRRSELALNAGHGPALADEPADARRSASDRLSHSAMARSAARIWRQTQQIREAASLTSGILPRSGHVGKPLPTAAFGRGLRAQTRNCLHPDAARASRSPAHTHARCGTASARTTVARRTGC